MRLLVKNELNTISGGYTCEEALIRDVEDFDFEFNPTQYCTKSEFTQYTVALINKIYEPSGWENLTEQTEIEIIKSLHL